MISTYLIICCTALLASTLTFFSGFGLGTLLLPAFVLAGFELPMAVALTAIVHLLNNIFKFILVGKNVDFGIVFRFGIPAAIGAFLGSQLLFIPNAKLILLSYQMNQNEYHVELMNLIIAVLIFIFAILELFSNLNFTLNKKWLPLGGIISGFFGGLSGHQGALRSAFLLRAGLTKEVFIASGIAISFFIDITRLSVYSDKIWNQDLPSQYGFLLAGTASAFIGAFLGNKLLKKITLNFLQIIVSILIILFSFALALGWV